MPVHEKDIEKIEELFSEYHIGNDVKLVAINPGASSRSKMWPPRNFAKLADSLARHNAVDFVQDGIKLNIKVPDEVTVEFEVEIESDESSIEVEISW